MNKPALFNISISLPKIERNEKIVIPSDFLEISSLEENKVLCKKVCDQWSMLHNKNPNVVGYFRGLCKIETKSDLDKELRFLYGFSNFIYSTLR